MSQTGEAEVSLCHVISERMFQVYFTSVNFISFKHFKVSVFIGFLTALILNMIAKCFGKNFVVTLVHDAFRRVVNPFHLVTK